MQKDRQDLSITDNHSSSSKIPVIAIIGAGFCGVMTAYRLIEQSRTPVRVLLLDPREPRGRGTAYQAISPAYVLNVPAAKMGALAGQPTHFWDWLEQNHPGRFRPESFVPRHIYGEYMDQMLAQLREKAAQGPAELVERNVRITAIQQDQDGIRLQQADGTSFRADRVVLATGNQAPAHPRLASGDPSGLRGYFQLPWQAACLQQLDPEQPVLLLGSGLTMVDLVLGLREQGFQGPIQALSPHGYVPQPHQPTPPWPDFLADRPWPETLSQWLGLVRRQSAAAAAAGVDWRAVVDALRPYSVRIWQSLSEKDRRRFMEHLRHRWGVLRHRLPAEISTRLQGWLADGSLSIQAGRVQDLRPEGEGIRVDWIPRHGNETRSLQVQRVINCTGPNGNYLGLPDPLYVSLREQSLLKADALGLGLDASPEGALLDASGQASTWLYTLGSALRGLYWESTAVPELREQAARLADHLLRSLK